MIVVCGALGCALVLWAEARVYSDNQRTWALIGGWAGLAVAGIVAMLGVAALVRRRGSRRTHIAFAAALGAVSTTCLVMAALVS